MITLATLAEATEQGIFDQVARHLLTQKRKSVRNRVGELGSCMYRFGGLKCAAGCLISDEEYNPDFEKKIWSSLIGLGKVPPEHGPFIRDLQGIHDSKDISQWREALSNFARNHELATGVLYEDYSQNAAESN